MFHIFLLITLILILIFHATVDHQIYANMDHYSNIKLNNKLNIFSRTKSESTCKNMSMLVKSM